MGTTRQTCWLAALTLTLSVGGPLEAGASSASLVEGYGRRPLAFEENRGQLDDRVRFLSRGDGYALFLTPSEAVLDLGEADFEQVLRLRWEGASPAPHISGEGLVPGRSHYFTGNDPSQWRTGIPSFARVRYQGVYPGIDLIFHGRDRQLEYDVVLAPGADPETVRLAIEGADRMEIDSAGDLVLHLGGGEVRLKRPISYQEIGGVRREVASAFRQIGEGRIGFAMGSHDPGRPLVIDPVLAYSTYLGGRFSEAGHSIAADAEGNAYVAGYTGSPDFPSAGAPPPPPNDWDVFVVKLDPAGALVYTSYLRGSSADVGNGVTLDASGNVYLTGWTNSSDFPQVHPLQPPIASLSPDAFVAKLDPAGTTLLYSTKLGGVNVDDGRGIAVDSWNNAYIVGVTDSPSFPTLQPLSPFRGGLYDLFVAKIDAAGTAVGYLTYLGGSDWDYDPAIAVDPQGHAYVTGHTYSADFPAVHSISSFAPGLFHAFATKLAPSGASYIYSTFLAGSSLDAGHAIAADAEGYAYVTGITHSPDFPTKAALQPFPNGGSDAFVTKLGPAGALVFSTFLGGRASEAGLGIAVDRFRNIYLTGYTQSPDFPLVDAFQAQCLPPLFQISCAQDVFITKLSPDGSKLVYSSFLGGAQGMGEVGEKGLGIAADSRGGAYVTGWTVSTDFPTVNAIQPSHGGELFDAFAARIVENRPPVCSAAFASPATLRPPNGKLVPIAIQGVADPDGDPITLAITGIRQDEPPGRQGPDAAGLGASTARVRADRAGGGDGRVYQLAFEARDPRGAACTGTVRVCVPHDQGRGKTCADGGPLFDSIGL